MAEDYKTELVSRMFESIPILFAILGAAFIVLAAAGGVDDKLPIKDAWGRIGLGAVGLAFCVPTVIAGGRTKGTIPKPERFGIKIDTPKDREEVTPPFEVRGTIQRPVPDGYTLMLLRIYPERGHYLPLGAPMITGQNWTFGRCETGGKSGDTRDLAACLIGPDAAMLLRYYTMAADEHRKTMKELENATGKPGEFLPLIKERPLDLIECHRVVALKRK
jgi:hypothetical protein